MNDAQDKRARLAAVIRALLAKTAEAGCSEAEAMAAATKARELMDRYHIDAGALGMEEEGTAKVEAPDVRARTMILSDRIVWGVAAFTDCKVWGTNKGWRLDDAGNTVRRAPGAMFFGLRSDAEFAAWLMASLSTQIKQAAAAYILHEATIAPFSPRERWEAEKSFLIGAASRVDTRLRTAAQERAASQATVAAATGGKSLIVVKGAIVEAAYRALGLKLRGGSRRSASVGNGGAYAAGRAAGDRATFGRPVGSQAAPLRLR